MKNKDYKKSLFIVLLACMIVLSNTLVVFGETKYKDKEEVVYAMLDGNGSIDEMYVVNIFDEDGEIIDYGDYSNVRNMITSDTLEQDGNKITVNNTNGKLYYEGQLKKNELPWNVEIKYYIDEKEYDANDIAGKSGELAMNINIVQNKDCDDVFFENYALQASVTLDTKRTKNIVAQGATVANIGSDKQLTYTILPGKGAEITISADIDDFEMKAIEINGIYLNLDVDIDDEDLIEKINELLDGVNKIDNGANDVKNGALELKDGSEKLSEGTKNLQTGSINLDNGIVSLKSGLDKIQNGLIELNNKSDSLTAGSAKFRATLINIEEEVANVSIEVEKIEELSNASSDIKKGIENLNDSTKLLKKNVGYSQYKTSMQNNGLNIDSLKQSNIKIIDMMTVQVKDLSKIYNEIKDVPGYEKQAGESKAQIDQLTKVIELLNGNNAAIVGNEKYINTISESISKLDEGAELLKENYQILDQSIDLMLKGLSDILADVPKLTKAVNTLVERYTELDRGINDYTEGVAKVVVGYTGIVDGVSDLNTGSKELKQGNDSLYQNISKLVSGTSDLYRGTVDLKEGTKEFKDKTSDMDEGISGEIDDVLLGLTGDKNKIRSFTSDENKQTKLVQFVIKTKDIEVPKTVITSQEPEFRVAFWEKLINLFRL